MLFFFAGLARAFDPSAIDEATLRRIVDEGQVVFVDETPSGKYDHVTGGALVSATPPEVWALITDYAAYPTWMPQVSACTVKAESGSTKDVEFTLDFEFSVITKHLTYTVREDLHPPDRIDFDFVEGELKDVRGSWQLVPIDGGRKTLVFYTTHSNLLSLGWIVKQLIQKQPSMEVAIEASTALTVVKAVRDRLHP